MSMASYHAEIKDLFPGMSFATNHWLFYHNITTNCQLKAFLKKPMSNILRLGGFGKTKYQEVVEYAKQHGLFDVTEAVKIYVIVIRTNFSDGHYPEYAFTRETLSGASFHSEPDAKRHCEKLNERFVKTSIDSSSGCRITREAVYKTITLI